jgi:hypothetical protein
VTGTVEVGAIRWVVAAEPAGKWIRTESRHELAPTCSQEASMVTTSQEWSTAASSRTRVCGRISWSSRLGSMPG